MPATIAQFMSMLALVVSGGPTTIDPGMVGPKIPFQSLSGPYADRTRLILRQPVVKRTRAAEVFPCDPVLLEWLFNHPIWATELWRTMGVTISPLIKVGDGYECREDSAMARVHVVHAEPGMRIAYCVGEARRPPLPGKLRAEMVVVQRYGFSKQTDGQYYAVQQLEAYAFAEGTALKTIMKLTRPACEQMVDRCLHDLTIYFAMLSRVIQVQPKWAIDLIERLQKTMPAIESAELTAIVARNPGRTRPFESTGSRKLGIEAAPVSSPIEPHGQPTVTTTSPFVSSWTVGPDSPATERKSSAQTAAKPSSTDDRIRR